MIPMEQFNRAILASISVIDHDPQTGGEAVLLYINLRDGTSRRFGHVEIVMPFDYLLQDIQELGWWQSDMACVVDGAGTYITHTGAMASMMSGRRKLGETGEELELAVLDGMGKSRTGTVMGSGHPPGHVAGFYRLGQTPWWTIIMFAPGREILKPIVHFAAYYSLAGGLGVALILVLIRLVEGRTVRSIREVSEVAHMISKGVYGEPVPEKGRDEISQLIHSFNMMTEGLKERDRIADTFGRYMDPDIARELMRSPEAVRLGGQKREVTILMSDIRGFSAIAESLTPEQTITVINRYFSSMIEEIRKHRGIIVDFFGDGILTFFDPLDGELEATTARAVRCALAMQRAAEALNSENERRGLPQLQTGIGVHVGMVVVGNVGSETRAKYGIVGSAVNITQRIESQAAGGEILLSESAYRKIVDQVNLKHTVERDLKGVQERMRLYVVAGFSS
jgi:class 3 adenylate cyclase